MLRTEVVPKIADLLATAPTFHDYMPLLPRAIELAANFRIGVYDCLYVALADLEGCELVTADQRLVNSLQPVLPLVVHLSSV